MSVSLNYLVKVSTAANRPLAAKDWEPIARRIAKAAKGGRNLRRVSVWVDTPFHCVEVNECGAVKVRKGGHDLSFK